MKVLTISSVVPNSKIGHAGGKTYYYYINQLSKEDNCKVSALCFCNKKQMMDLVLDESRISYKILLSSGTIVTNINRIIFDIFGKLSSYGRLYSNYKKHKILQYLKKQNKMNLLPDAIQLEYTEMVLLAKYIKRQYPSICIIGSEHDITFQAEKRKIDISKNKLLQIMRYKVMHKEEMKALHFCDYILTQSDKDKQIILGEGISPDKVLVISPYYHNMSSIIRKKVNNDILFWGAMYRPENYMAALWFIDNVMPLLEDLNIRFIVAGNRPPQKLKSRENEKIIITGYIEDEIGLFENSLCFVAPLLTGAGIKVKIIEALSSGIPTLTNSIGIEGIPASNGIHYFHCENAKEYAEIISDLYKKNINIDVISNNQLELVKENFDLSLSMERYKKLYLKR